MNNIKPIGVPLDEKAERRLATLSAVVCLDMDEDGVEDRTRGLLLCQAVASSERASVRVVRDQSSSMSGWKIDGNINGDEPLVHVALRGRIDIVSDGVLIKEMK